MAQLLARCVCGVAVGEPIERAGVAALLCHCGVARLRTQASVAEHAQQYASGEYHRAEDRHAGCMPYAQRYEHDLQVAALRWQRYREVLGAARIERTTTVLDVGCANGAFVDYVRTQGVWAWGLDPSPEFERELIVRGTTEDLRYLGLDLVTYHDVLEHLVDPQGELLRAAGMLAPRGLLIVDVPNVWGGGGDHHWKVEHLWYFTEDALMQMLGDAQLVTIAVDRPIPGKLVLYAERAG